MILVVYFSCTLTVKSRLWLTKYQRNRINFSSFVWSVMLILIVSGVDFDEIFSHEDFYTSWLVISFFYTSTALHSSETVSSTFSCFPCFYSSVFCVSVTWGVSLFNSFIGFVFLTPWTFSVTFFTLWSSSFCILLQINGWCHVYTDANDIMTYVET